MSESGPDWGAVAAGAMTDQVEEATRTAAQQMAAYYLTLRRRGVPTRAALALTQHWQTVVVQYLLQREGA